MKKFINYLSEGKATKFVFDVTKEDEPVKGFKSLKVKIADKDDFINAYDKMVRMNHTKLEKLDFDASVTILAVPLEKPSFDWDSVASDWHEESFNEWGY